MTKNVLVTISGKRMMNDGDEDVELVIPGTYCRKAGLHTVCYEEPGEGDDPGTRNTILIGSDGRQILKEGMANVRMAFLNRADRVTSCYSTPFGDFMIGIVTRDIKIDESRDRLNVAVDYAMDIGDQHVSDCSINVEIVSRTPSV